jgi:hypothetical protein
MGIARRCGVVEKVVDLVEKAGAVALASAKGGSALGSVGGGQCRWWVVESYISGLLL